MFFFKHNRTDLYCSGISGIPDLLQVYIPCEAFQATGSRNIL